MTRYTFLVPVRAREGSAALDPRDIREFYHSEEAACRRLDELGEDYELRRAILIIGDEAY